MPGIYPSCQPLGCAGALPVNWPNIFRELEKGTDPRTMAESWKPAVAEFERMRQQYRLY